MFLRFILYGALLGLPFLAAGGAAAHEGGRQAAPTGATAVFDARRPDPSLSGARETQLFDVPSPARAGEAPIVLAQQVDPRVNGLEEQLRNLTGKIEELNFQVLQMQDQIHRMQEDNEFRFQQIEGNAPGGDTAAPPPDKRSSVTPETIPKGQAAPGGDAMRTVASGGEEKLGAPPRTFGTITFDADGNVVGGALGDATLSAPDEGSQDAGAGPADDGATVAALPPAGNADELYRNSYEFILSGDYKTAEAGFRQHIKDFPGDTRAADAHFWLGEALLGQDRYRDAAEVFLRANRDYPDARKAPDMLLKLGISLAAMNQRDVACATYAQIGQRYPGVSSALQQRIKQEQALAGC